MIISHRARSETLCRESNHTCAATAAILDLLISPLRPQITGGLNVCKFTIFFYNRNRCMNKTKIYQNPSSANLTDDDDTKMPQQPSTTDAPTDADASFLHARRTLHRGDLDRTIIHPPLSPASLQASRLCLFPSLSDDVDSSSPANSYAFASGSSLYRFSFTLSSRKRPLPPSSEGNPAKKPDNTTNDGDQDQDRFQFDTAVEADDFLSPRGAVRVSLCLRRHEPQRAHGRDPKRCEQFEHLGIGRRLRSLRNHVLRGNHSR